MAGANHHAQYAGIARNRGAKAPPAGILVTNLGILRIAAMGTVAAIALELCAREVVRRSPLELLTGLRPDHTLLAVVAAILAAGGMVASRTALTGRWRLWFIFGALFAGGVAAQLNLGARLQSDGFYYFAYLRSLAFDRDVEFTNDYRLLGLGDKAHLFRPTRTNHAQSAWTIGPAIVWSPFFAAGHLVARELSRNNPNVTANGISFPYRQAVCIAGLTYGLLGCWFMFGIAARLTDSRIAAAATTATVSGSFMLWYMVKEPSMTHAPSMALVAAFVLAWLVTREKRSTAQWILLGLLAGFMTLVRWQNAIFALLPACDSAVSLLAAWRAGKRDEARDIIVNGLLFTAAATVGFLPQMLAWKAIYGSWLAVSPVGPQIRFRDPHLIDILWSARNGLFSSSPVLAAGAAGLMLYARSVPAIGVPCLLAVAMMTYFNACIQDWWGSAGYGGRRFDGTLPFFCIGAAYAARRSIELVRRFPAAALAAAAAGLVLWNLTQMAIAQAGILRIGEAVSFGDTMSAQARQFHAWFGNPFTYPASIVYGLRNGVAPGRYDLLSANRFLADPLLPYARIDIGGGDAWLVEDGWHDPEHEGNVSFRWTAQQAGLLAPLDHAATLRVQFRLHAFNFPDAPPQAMKLFVNGREHGPQTVEGGWHTMEFLVEESVWRAGVNRIRLDFARANRPADVGLGGDPRMLAAALDFFRVMKVE